MRIKDTVKLPTLTVGTVTTVCPTPKNTPKSGHGFSIGEVVKILHENKLNYSNMYYTCKSMESGNEFNVYPHELE